MFKLYPYQAEAIAALYDYFARSTGNPILALPTGTGKSIVIAEFVRRVFTDYPTQRLMMLTHVQELIEQNFEELVALWPLAPAGVYSAGLSRKEIRPITFAGIQSVVKKAAEFGHIDLVLIDEAHLVSPHDETSYQNFLADLRAINPAVKVIGLTATPYRLGQGLLTQPVETKKGPRPSLFTDIAFDITGMSPFNRLIEEGYLCRLVPKRTGQQLDLSGVGRVGGEFKLDELQLATDRPEITRRAIDETVEVAGGMPHSSGRPRCRWLVFGTGIEHVEHILAEFLERGFAAKMVTSKTAKGERAATIKWFKQDTEDLRVLVNNGVLTTGFNCRQLDVIVELRATNSPGLHVQILGRGTRVFPGKDDCLVMDFAGNTKRLGPINDPVIPRGKGKKGGGEAPVKVCEKCGTYNHASVTICTHCGAEFPRAVKIVASASSAELIRSDSPQVEIFAVDRVSYHEHLPHDREKPPSLRVVYYCGLRQFSEWWCLQHGGMVGEKARNYWRAATIHAEIRGAPSSIVDAMTRLETLREPKHIRVWVNLKHPRVMDRDYNGHAFARPGNSGLPQQKVVA